MANTVQHHIYILDGAPKEHEITEILEKSGMKVRCFAHMVECLAQLRSGPCHLLITDLRMPEMDGIGLIQEVKHLVPWLPVLIVSDHGDVPMAVKAIKAGAVDFIQKPLDKENFVRVVRSILSQNRAAAEIDLGGLLTQSEARVLALVIKGKTNKEIAQLLHRSIKTIEVHRSHIMRKLEVHNLVELVNRVASLRLATTKANRRPDHTFADSKDSGPSTR